MFVGGMPAQMPGGSLEEHRRADGDKIVMEINREVTSWQIKH